MGNTFPKMDELFWVGNVSWITVCSNWVQYGFIDISPFMGLLAVPVAGDKPWPFLSLNLPSPTTSCMSCVYFKQRDSLSLSPIDLSVTANTEASAAATTTSMTLQAVAASQFFPFIFSLSCCVPDVGSNGVPSTLLMSIMMLRKDAANGDKTRPGRGLLTADFPKLCYGWSGRLRHRCSFQIHISIAVEYGVSRELTERFMSKTKTCS